MSEGLQAQQGRGAQEAPAAGSVAGKDLEAWRAGPRYEMIRKLGSGSYGCVFEARDTQTGEAVAVKRVELVDDPVHFRRTLREVSMLGVLRDNESIVKLLDIVAPLRNGLFDEIYLVMERCRSDLRKFFRSECTLSPIQARRVMYTTLRGIAYLHSGGIWHRDLKPENCLIDPSCDVKIADFGLSRAVGWCELGGGRTGSLPAGDLCGAGEPRTEGVGVQFRKRPQVDLTAQVCTRWYRAPELLLSHGEYTEAIDIWSMGCIFAELLQCLSGSEHKKLRGPLFPGDYCRRPGRDDATTVEQVPTPCRRPAHDMLDLVFQVIGTPSEADVARLRSESDRRHVLGFTPRKGCGIQARVPEADDEATEVLQQTLRFSAADRATVCELLEHRLFSQVREQAGEKLAPGVLKLRFEEEPDDVRSLEPYLVREVHRYQKLF